MSKVLEITSLLVSLASQLNSINPATGNESTNVDLTIANLNRSLNLSGTIPRIRVLDTSLSVMCFTSSQVFNCTIEYLVNTIAAVLSSSIECQLACTSTNSTRYLPPPTSNRYPVALMATGSHAYEVRCISNFISLLKDNLMSLCDANMLRENSNEEFSCCKVFWVPRIVSLLFCRGLASILELLVSILLDILSRPMRWGITMDLGSKLPFSHSYFPCKKKILRVLTGPLSLESLEFLVHEFCKPVDAFSKTAVNVAKVNQSSIWAATIAFPSWFIFASILLFSEKSLRGTYYSMWSR
ncbi:hypothetical protein CQW23_27065 [Capsicum baccatum]|uniref:Uncharacterized protein n=1 Tax=Capsicum baccatum TaxID=33114 RepID=A0A2G2VQK6_CAPBA|nr:hypothetical protein CQW23_27065 [Capsicum baccatum]